eukprot:gene17169-22685_t
MNQSIILAILLLFSLLNIALSIPPIGVIASVRGKKYEVNAETVEEVVQQVESLANLEIGQQHVLYRGKVLNPVDKLEDLGITPGDVLNVVKRRLQRNIPSDSDSSGGSSGLTSSVGPDGNSLPANLDEEALKKLSEKFSPEDMKKAMQAMDKLLDSDFINEYFGDDEKLEKARLTMLENVDQYDDQIPGFKEQAREVASDPVKWREAMLQAKEQLIQLKKQRDSLKAQQQSQQAPSPDIIDPSTVDDVGDDDEE